MIHNDVLSQLQLLIKTSAPALLEVSQQQLELPQLVPGERVQAHVVANLPNGRFQVLIADKSLDLNLPRNTQPGDTVDLVLVTSQPRLTFALARDLGQVANLPKPQVSLSETARFLGALLEKAAEPETRRPSAGTVAQSAPVLAGAPSGKALDFAQALRGALAQSGLFYESHQAQWVTGQRPLSDLLREPQGRLSPSAANPPPRQTPLQPAESGAAARPDTMPSPQTESALAPRTALLAGQSAEPPVHAQARHDGGDVATPIKTASLDQPAHPDTLPLVRQQLEILDSRQLMWQGQVWPGQNMDWRIEEREAREQGGEIEVPRWQTSLRLVLPILGEVSANLALHPNGVSVQLTAGEPATAKLMQDQQETLSRSMESSGLPLLDIKVSHDAAG